MINKFCDCCGIIEKNKKFKEIKVDEQVMHLCSDCFMWFLSSYGSFFSCSKDEN
ncbi:MAG: hypothetical protein ACOC1P_03150 [Minisyncoccales bacterium]